MSDLAEMKLLTVPAAARSLSVSITTLYRILDGGELVSYKINGSRRIAEEDILDFLAGCRGTKSTASSRKSR